MTTFNDLYKTPIRAGVLWMVVLGFLTTLSLGMGEAFGCFRFALVAYWLLFALILFRRPMQPTLTDLMLLKWVFPLLYGTGFLVYAYAMHLRGLR